MRVAAVAAAVRKESLLRTRVRRGAVDEQRELFAELFGVGGAGFAGGAGEPCGDGLGGAAGAAASGQRGATTTAPEQPQTRRSKPCLFSFAPNSRSWMIPNH